MSMLFPCVEWWTNLCGWYLEGTFRRCRHIFRESNKAAETHANWFMDNDDSGPGAQWMAPDLRDKMQNHVMLCCLSMGPEGRADLVRLLGFNGYGMNTVLLRKSPTVDVC